MINIHNLNSNTQTYLLCTDIPTVKSTFNPDHYRITVLLILLLYVVIVGAVTIALEIPELLVLLIVIVSNLFNLQLNILFILFIAKLVIRMILFPYGSKMITNFFDGDINYKFGTEFIKILQRTINLMRKELGGEIGNREEQAKIKGPSPLMVNKSKTLPDIRYAKLL